MSTVPSTVLDALPDPIILVDAGRIVVAVNRAARDAFGPNLVGRDLSLGLRHPAVLTAVDRALAGMEEVTAEVSLPVPVPRTFLLRAVRLNPGVGDTAAVALVLSETTDTLRAEQMRADFVANASHELRSPLASVLGFIETIRGHAADDAAARARFLDIMYREATRMARLIDDLLSLSRVEVNEHVAPKDPVDLRRVLGNVVETLGPRAEARGMELKLTVAESLPAVVGDADQLVQVFRNLVENAIRYAREKTPVSIEAVALERIPDLGGPGVGVSVVDQGEGIQPEHLPRLTERFYRVDKARSQAMGGTGLGLAIVKHIVSRHRGRLQIDSQPGKGSRFTVFLPARR